MRTYPHCRHCRKQYFGCPEEEERKYHVVGCGKRSCNGNSFHQTERETTDMPGGNAQDRLAKRFMKALANRKQT